VNKVRSDPNFPPVRGKTHLKEEKSTSWDKVTDPISEERQLSNEQAHVLDLVLSKRKSVFFTGNAGMLTFHNTLIHQGTGKSFLLREIIRELRKVYSYDALAVTGTFSQY
jgi:ATP-dependent DNA helicase PIF1